MDDETKPSENAAKDSSPVTSKDTDTDGKPDVNDVLVKETQVIIEVSAFLELSLHYIFTLLTLMVLNVTIYILWLEEHIHPEFL